VPGPPATGREVVIEFAGLPARAWLPATLADRTLDIETPTVRAAAAAAGSILRADDRLSPRLESLGRLLHRSEAVASSNIEGLSAPATDVLLAGIDERLADETAAWIADNLAVIDDCLGHARSRRRLTLADLDEWHERLMRHGGLPRELVGQLRDRQGWIGGTGPATAAYVPPPPEHLPALMSDLLAYTNDGSTDPVVQAAVAHAQLETIHPWGDGNGRIGRLLVMWIVARRLAVMPPPASVFISSDPGGYLSGLTLFRGGPVDGWVRWFAQLLDQAALASIQWADRVEAVEARWVSEVADMRADAAARRLLPELARQPVVSPGVVADLLGVSASAARAGLAVLVDRGILVPLEPRGHLPGRPSNWYAARALLDLGP